MRREGLSVTVEAFPYSTRQFTSIVNDVINYYFDQDGVRPSPDVGPRATGDGRPPLLVALAVVGEVHPGFLVELPVAHEAPGDDDEGDNDGSTNDDDHGDDGNKDKKTM